MIYQSFILDNLVSLCLKLMNSVVVVGLYYGFLTTFSIGPSYLFLIRAQVMEKGTEKKIAATTGFITGQLMMFLSIYYAPLHLALSRPHTITALTLPYLLFNFFNKNGKYYYSEYMFDSGYKNPNSIRKFSIYKVFFNNLVFQLLNPLLFSSSILIRLVNIYLFRCNNKLLFLTSSFVGWLIGHIFLMKSIGLILVWLQQNNSIKSKVTIRFDKYIMLKLRNYVGQIFVVFLFITFLHYLGRIPLPYFFTEEILETQQKDETEEKDEIEEMDIEMDSEETKEDLSRYLFSTKENTLEKIEEETDVFGFQKPLVTILFDFQRWNRPLRYIKNDHFENVVRNENSQFFFHICQSDGKERISFTYPPNLSTFLKIIEKKIDLFTRDKISDNELSNYWKSTNQEKRKKLSNEFLKRAKVLDKEFRPLDGLENRIRLCNDEKKKKYLPKIYDPFLNGRFRGQIQKSFSPSIQNETYTTNSILINKIHGILLSNNSNYSELEQKIDPFDGKSLLTEIGFFFNLMSKFSEKSVSNLNFDGLYLFPEHQHGKLYSEEKKRKKKFLFDAIRTDLNDQTIFNGEKCIGINEISKKVPRWSYKLIDELEQLTDRLPKDAQIRSRKAERIVIFNNKTNNYNEDFNTLNLDNSDDNEDNIDTIEPTNEFILLNYSREPDFSRDIIKGSMRAQRRKTVTWKLFQSHAHSPLFLGKIQKSSFFLGDLFYDISQYLKEYFRKEGTDNSEFLAFEKRIQEDQKEEKKNSDEKRLREIEEAWDSILYGLILRSFVLIAQSILRKYIILPSLIITKNIIRIFLFQNPEWSEDFRDWKKEVHIKCTYQGIPVSNKEFPQNWVKEGLQIRILSPFVLKPWHRSKVQSTEKKKRSIEKKKVKKKNFWFLTACGTQVESYLDNYFPNPFSFLGPILKKIKKQLKINLKNRFFLVITVLNERKKWFLTILKEIGKWNIKSILFRLQNRYELSESKKNSTISTNNPMIYESPVRIQSINWTNSSFTEKRIKDLNVKTNTIINQIEKMTHEKNEEVITSEKNLNSNKTIYDAKRLELEKNGFQIFQRRNVRLIRKSYSFFKFFIEGVYMDILLCIIRIPRINVQLFLESTKKVVNKSIYKKKTNAERIDKTNQSIIPFMSIIQKSCNITNTNSQNSYDVSSLSQAYVFFKLSQTPFRHKNLSHSGMTQWTNWLKIHYQYDLPESRWSRLVTQKWRNRINEHRVVQNKDLIEYDSYEKTRLILSKKQELDLLELEFKKKIKKQYRYDLLSYKYINYADKKKSSIFGYRSPFQTNKNQAISYNDNTRKKEFLDIMGDISIQNYIAEDVILDRDKNLDRKYFDWKVMDVEIQNHSISNPKFWFFSKLWIFYDAYKKNPWIIPTKSLFYGNEFEAEYANRVDLQSSLSNQDYEGLDRENDENHIDFDGYRNDLKGERYFLLEKYLGFHLNSHSFLQEGIMNNVKFYCLLIRLKNIKKFFIISIKKGELNLDTMAIQTPTDFTFTGFMNNKELMEKQIFFIEPIRLSRKNYENFFMYQTISLSLIHKNKGKIFQRNPEKSRVDKNHYDLFVPENILSSRRRRELRILTCFNSRNTVHRNTINDNENKINNSCQVLAKKKDLDRETKKLMNLKFFLWPNYRLEDLACLNRYWFDTHNGSRFSILRIHMYPRLKI